jgi:hypothetical protein
MPGDRTQLIRPELKSWDCADLDPIENWVPDGEALYSLTVSIGPPGSPAADNYQVCVATPAGLRSGAGQRSRPKGSDRPKAIVLQSYSWAGVVAAIEERLDACAGRDWDEVQDKLKVQFEWEYEGCH